mgnify:CR=1 FL=1
MSLRDRFRGTHNNQSTEDGYEMFHSARSERSRRVNVPAAPGELYSIGRLVALIYLPYGSSHKKHEQYIHHFGDFGTHKDTNPAKFPVLASDQDGELHIVRDASPYKNENRGIVG